MEQSPLKDDPREGKSQFIGAAGEYFVAYSLAVEKLHAAITPGNALDVDILVATRRGDRSAVLQVKTASHARNSPQGFMPWCEWTVGKMNDGPRRDLWYAFVDLQKAKKSVSRTDRPRWNPKLFLVPSFWVERTAKKIGKRWFFRLPKSCWEQTEGLQKLQEFLTSERDSLSTWMNVCPEQLLQFVPRQTLPG